MARQTAITEDVEGLTYVEELISAEDERDLLAFLETLDYRPVVMRGQAARRTVRHFGLDYDYEHGELVSTDPLPAELRPLRGADGARARGPRPDPRVPLSGRRRHRVAP